MTDEYNSVDRQELSLEWLAEYGDALFAYAMIRVSDRTIAEDLVQETFLAAIKSVEQFRGASSPRTWLTAILRNKVVDHFRSTNREKQLTDRVAEEIPEALVGRHFDRKYWGPSPDSALADIEFWQVFEFCRQRLPTHLLRAFVMREMHDMDTNKVCEVLDVKPSNLAVRVHRARTLLRKCLEDNWFVSD